ncbi:hypothetical protein BY458DRAFT_512691 [Sporodiniella umbellata]|nr:hypothetical protein BY458DRAFT_512691 [Sporodiniella umbellata]
MSLEDEMFSTISSSSEDSMELYADRCSICFDSQYDMYLKDCKDQFCVECFEKYVTHTVKSSWGLSVTTIKCPVCNILVHKREWGRYVPRSIVALYEKHNTPYRSYSRVCSHCDVELKPCTQNGDFQQLSSICAFLNTVVSSCSKQEKHVDNNDHTNIYEWIKAFRQGYSEIKSVETYKQLIKDIFQFEKSHASEYSTIRHQYSHQLSLLYLKTISDPEVWKQLQFMHIGFFPNMNCLKCQTSICLHCGYDSHLQSTCEENMHLLVQTRSLTTEALYTIMWKLQNSRQCPSCSIMINRDEGCNKVDCSYCGFAFCWCCRSSWSEGCGFYRCPLSSNHHQSISDYQTLKTEAGVPDIKDIQARANTIG